MKAELETGLRHLDAAHVANCRVSSVSTLLMTYDDQGLLEAEDLRALGDLIRSQNEIMRDCLSHFRQVVEINSSSQ